MKKLLLVFFATIISLYVQAQQQDTIVYHYDNLQRLTSVEYVYPATTVTKTYTYDQVGNRLSISVTVNHGTHNVVTETACESFTWHGQTYTTSGTYTYNYTNATGCASVDTLKLTVNHGTHNVLTETACESFTWHGTEYTTSGTYTYGYNNADGCDSVVTLHLTVNQPTAGIDVQTACGSYTWIDGVTYTESNSTATYTLTNAAGCDSVVTLNLTLNHAETAEFSETACNYYEWNGETFTTSGDFTRTLTNANGCDSVVTLHLTVNQPTAGIDVQTACGSYTWIDGVTYTESNSTATYTLTNAAGCDSVVTLNLTLNHAETAEFSETACNYYEWNGETFTTSGDFTRTLTNANGCDSVVTLHLTVNPTYNVTDTRSVCPSEMPYTWNGFVFNSAGVQTVTLQTANGCDSTVTMILTVNQTHVTTDSRTVCQSDLPYSWNGITFSAAGVQTAALPDANGCDSTVIMTLTVNPTYNITLTHTVCQNELPYTWNGVVFNAAGSQNLTLQTASGCDSLVTLVLTVNPTYNVTDTRSVCPSEMPYTWNGVVFNAAGAQSVTLQAANGCDSTVTMILTVNQTHVTTDSRTVCQSELPYSWNGITFSSAGVMTATLQDANGCDSTVIMTLTVNPTYNITETQSVCQSDLPYTWHGITFDAAGTQVLNLQTVSGCDSVITMTLTVNSAVQSDLYETVCDSHEWNGITYTESGDYTKTLTAANGCDSVVTLHLTISSSEILDFSETACEQFVWEGTTYTVSGDYTKTLTNASGCDSVVTLHLTINHAVSSEFAVETSDSCYSWNGHLYCQSGDYTQTLTAANGCDSVVTLHLTITVGIDNHEDFDFKVYPNPTTGVVNVECSMNVQVFHVFDTYGKLMNVVETDAHGSSAQTTPIDLSGFANGVYFVKAVADGNAVAVRKVVKL